MVMNQQWVYTQCYAWYIPHFFHNLAIPASFFTPASNYIAWWQIQVCEQLAYDCHTVFLLLYADQRWLCTLSRDNWRPICSRSDVLVNRRNRQVLLWRFVILAQDIKMQTYLLTYSSASMGDESTTFNRKYNALMLHLHTSHTSGLIIHVANHNITSVTVTDKYQQNISTYQGSDGRIKQQWREILLPSRCSKCWEMHRRSPITSPKDAQQFHTIICNYRWKLGDSLHYQWETTNWIRMNDPSSTSEKRICSQSTYYNYYEKTPQNT